jgi:hypothetical protein
MTAAPNFHDQQKNPASTGFLVVLILAIIAGFGILVTYRPGLPENGDVAVADTNASVTPEVAGEETIEATPAQAPLPERFSLDVPFTTQAPFANWELPYQEACEEASAITVHYYYAEKTFTKEIADREILDLVAFENNTLGFYEDTTAEELARVIKAYWGYARVDVIENPSVEDIKRHVSEGRPVIVPAAGRELDNPNFRSPGPLYHMFVIRGFDRTHFFTNDVGTRKGENFRYDISNVMYAMHDWNSGDVVNGAKRIIVVYPNDAA